MEWNIQMCHPECEMKELSLFLLSGYSEEAWLLLISSWRTAQCHEIQKTPSNLVSLKHRYKLTELLELHTPFVYLPAGTTLLIISLFWQTFMP
jgi:hypothetical protein